MELLCGFTGHRPATLGEMGRENSTQAIQLKSALAKEVKILVEAGSVRHFVSGMAQGCDTWLAETVLSLRETEPITLTCALPFPEQAERWSIEYQARHRDILAECDRIVQICPWYIPQCFCLRNEWIVDNTHMILSVYNGIGSSGTAQTINYAMDAGKHVVMIDPATLKVYSS